tara:strand:+ start:5639 stop:6541 length:903 start_codon:yes stop_codon:yes gene_type:complete
MNLSIIGSSKIIEHHIIAAKKVGFKVKAIFSSNKNSKNAQNLKEKFKIDYNFKTIGEFIKFSEDKKCSIIIAGRVRDNEIFLLKSLKTKNKIFIEKPVFYELKKFDKFFKYRAQIFIGYNRLFYKNIKLIERKIKNQKEIEVFVSCPESSVKGIKRNTCHIISIIYFLFKDAKIISSNKNGRNFYLRMKCKKGFINLFLNLNSPENFKIELNLDKEKIILSPIERIKIFKGIEKIIVRNQKIYNPIKTFDFDENSSSNYKPGFLEQMKLFKKFVKNKKTLVPDMRFAKKIMTTCDLLTNL